MTFGINPVGENEKIALCSIWPVKDGENKAWAISLLDARLVKGDGGITLYGKMINHTGDVASKKDKASKFAKANDYQGLISFSISDESSYVVHKAISNLLKTISFATPICLTLAISTSDAMTKSYASKSYESPIPGQEPVLLNDEQLLAVAQKAGALNISAYTGEPLFKEEELVSRKGSTGNDYNKGKSVKELMAEREECLNELNRKMNPGIDISDALLNDAFYRYASIVIK